MAHLSPATLLTFTVLGILSVATAAGYVLKAKLAAHSEPAVIDNLNLRIKSWWIMAVAIGLALLLGKGGVIVLFGFVSLAALREYVSLAPTRQGDYWALVLAFFVVLPFQYYLVWIEWYSLFALFIPVYAFLALPIVAVVASDTKDFMQRTATTQWGLMIAVFCLSHVPALLTLDIPGYASREAFLVVFLIIVVQTSDVLQFVWGKLCGKMLIAPALSPSKTVEGFIGGIFSATLIGAALSWITPFSIGEAALIALVITLMGFLGGLVMSALKRDRGVKDWGTLIEGHGGMLDRMDAVCFSAPIFFHVVRYWWAV